MTRASVSIDCSRQAPRPAPIPRRVWAIAGIATFGAFMSGLDTSLVNVGVETIGHDLHTDLASTQWISSGYLLALAAALPVSGWASRRIGAGRAWLLALAAFTVTSGLCATAPSVSVLVVFRVWQGLAGGLLVSAGTAILAQSAGREAMGRVLSIAGIPTVLAPALGPSVGAVLLAHLSWPWLFLINVPIGVMGLALGLRYVPRGEVGHAGRLDVAALMLIGSGLPLFTYGITQAAQQESLAAPGVYLCLVGGVAALIAFALRSLRQTDPLLDLRVYRDRVFTAASSLLLFSSVALFGGQIVMPLYFQLQRQRSIIDTGLLLLPFGLGAAATFPIAGRLTDRYGGGRVATAGLGIVTLATIPMALLDAQANLVLVEALQALRGVGLALAGAPTMAAAMSAVDRHQLDDASAQLNVVARVGGALGSALMVVILTHRLSADATGAQTTGPFHATFWWLSSAAFVACAGAGWLAFEQRRVADYEGTPA